MKSIFHYLTPASRAISCLLMMAVICVPQLLQAQTLTIADGLGVIASRGYDMRIARARQSSAEWAGTGAAARLKPQVSAYADQTWLENRPEAVFGGGTSPLSEDQTLRYGVTVRQLITDFGKTRAGVEAARAGSRVQAIQTVMTRNEGALDFILSYVSLLQAQRNLSLADQVVQRYEFHLVDARALHQAGEVTLNDVLTTQVALADAQLGLIDAQDALVLSASRVNFLVLRPFDEPVAGIEFPSPLAGLPEREEIIASAEANRVELKILGEEIAAAEARLRHSEAEGYPSLFAGGGYSYEENPYRVHEDNWSATIGLTWDLYTGGARKASEGQASGELSALIARREKVSRIVGLEALDSHRLLTGATQRKEVAGKAVEQAQENLRLQHARYTEGEVSATEVTDAITALAQAELNQWSALYGMRRAEARLLYAMGTDLVERYSGSGGLSENP
ncbi:MAG: TolC family protein [bacterium]|nr:TolC family protein [bacterium]